MAKNVKLLRCPVCKGRVETNKGAVGLICSNPNCERYCVYAW